MDDLKYQPYITNYTQNISSEFVLTICAFYLSADIVDPDNKDDLPVDDDDSKDDKKQFDDTTIVDDSDVNGI